MCVLCVCMGQDVAAGSIILKEAGGAVADLDGSEVCVYACVCVTLCVMCIFCGPVHEQCVCVCVWSFSVLCVCARVHVKFAHVQHDSPVQL